MYSPFPLFCLSLLLGRQRSPLLPLIRTACHQASVLCTATLSRLCVLQSQREVTLAGFRSGKFPVLVATDVAARGLDISGVELVVQCEPPKDPETYIHRSGMLLLDDNCYCSLLCLHTCICICLFLDVKSCYVRTWCWL